MHKPKPKYGWHGKVVEAAPSKALVSWTGEVSFRDIIMEMRATGARQLRTLVQRKADPSRVPDEHFAFAL